MSGSQNSEIAEFTDDMFQVLVSVRRSEDCNCYLKGEYCTLASQISKEIFDVHTTQAFNLLLFLFVSFPDEDHR